MAIYMSHAIMGSSAFVRLLWEETLIWAWPAHFWITVKTRILCGNQQLTMTTAYDNFISSFLRTKIYQFPLVDDFLNSCQLQVTNLLIMYEEIKCWSQTSLCSWALTSSSQNKNVSTAACTLSRSPFKIEEM